MKVFDRQTLKEMRAMINTALMGIEGVNFELGNIRFDQFTFSCKLKASINSPEVRQSSVRKFPDGIKLGKKVIVRGIQYEIVDYNPRRWKKPVIIKRVRDGKQFVCAESYIS